MLLVFVGGVYGCATQSATQSTAQADADISTFITAQRREATRLEEAGALHDALIRWKSLRAANDPDALSQIQRIGILIDTAAATARESARKAFTHGDSGLAQTHYLSLLALIPNDQEGLRRLRELKTAEVKDQQARKVAAEIQKTYEVAAGLDAAVLTRFETYLNAGQFLRFLDERVDIDSPDDDSRFREMHFSALAGLASDLEASGELAEAAAQIVRAQELIPARAAEVEPARLRLHKQLGERWYAQGLRLMRRDPVLAIEALEKAVAYEPGNIAAVQQLERARRMQANLDKLKRLTGS